MTDIKTSLKGNQLADLTVLLGLAGLVIWYFLDARNASSHVLNLVLILPLTGVTLALCVLQFCRQFWGECSAYSEAEPVRQVFPIVILFMAYILTLPWLGFDVGTGIFIAASLWTHGERRLPWVLGYSVCFASLAALVFAAMLPYPMPMLIFPS